jgi:hypothetical protein|tara:strand:+ start:1199 stop:1921 length:723 start_codon:yes stop_codon:yes gene_type:complete
MSIVKSLDGEIIGIKTLTKNDMGEMYGLMTSHYDNVNIETFQRDLSEKKDVILLRELDKGSIKGFSTLMLLEETVDGNSITALFSGDTIIDKEYWGTNELPKWWGKYAFSLIDEMPDQELYWFLMSKGYKTYRFLPVFFNEFYPRRGVEFPERDKMILDTFASSKFPKDYNFHTGVISFDKGKDYLKQGVADIDDSRMKNSDVKYFVERNPNWQQGDELACLVRLTKDNFNKVGHKIVNG